MRWITIFWIGILFGSAASATTLHHWRFEDAPGLLEDSAGTATLSGDGVQLALPLAGPGSLFAPGTLPNDFTADFTTAEEFTAVLPDAPTGDFTIEAFVDFDSLVSSFGLHIAGTAESALNNTIGWSLEYRTSLNAIALVVCLDSSCDILDSGVTPVPGKDYFVAAAFDVIDPNSVETTFYIENLTDATGLQTITVPGSKTAYNGIDTFAIGAMASGSLSYSGLIDEVRLSDEPLEAGQLLLFAPEPGAALGWIAALGLAFRMRLARRPRP